MFLRVESRKHRILQMLNLAGLQYVKYIYMCIDVEPGVKGLGIYWNAQLSQCNSHHNGTIFCVWVPGSQFQPSFATTIYLEWGQSKLIM